MKKIAYRYDIDGLRGIAVLAVILGHFWPDIFPSAYLGVDVFFVISGYVITSSIQRYRSEKLSSFLAIFFAKRIKRIMPALLFCLVSVSFLSLLLIPNAVTSLMTAFTAAIGLSNLFLIYSSTDYFGLAAEYNLFTHTWSLGVEEQFYFIYPMIFWVSMTYLKKENIRVLLTLLVTLSLFCFIFFSVENPVWSYYFPLFRAWEFLIGAGLFFWRNNNVVSQQQRLLLASFLILIVTFFVDKSPFLTTVILVFTTALIMYYSVSGTIIFKLLTSKLMQWLGLRSYSIYLWHWPILVFTKITLGTAVEWLFLAILLTVVVSELSYNTVEKRFRAINTSPSTTYKVGFVTTFSVLCLIVLSAKPLQGKLLVVDNYTGSQAVHSSLPCHSGSLITCLNKENTEGKTVFVIGDSHATNLVPSAQKAAENYGFQFNYFGGIKFIRTIFNDPACQSYHCIESNINAIKQAFAKVGKGDIVFFSMSRSRLYLPDHYLYEGVSRQGKENESGLTLLHTALTELYDFLNAKGASFVIVDDIPVTCSLSDYLRLNVDRSACMLDYNASIADRKPLTELYMKLMAEKQTLAYLDPHQSLCSKASCDIFDNHVLLYTDTSPHLSEEHKYRLVDIFDHFLKEQVQQNGQLLVNLK